MKKGKIYSQKKIKKREKNIWKAKKEKMAATDMHVCEECWKEATGKNLNGEPLVFSEGAMGGCRRCQEGTQNTLWCSACYANAYDLEVWLYHRGGEKCVKCNSSCCKHRYLKSQGPDGYVDLCFSCSSETKLPAPVEQTCACGDSFLAKEKGASCAKCYERATKALKSARKVAALKEKWGSNAVVCATGCCSHQYLVDRLTLTDQLRKFASVTVPPFRPCVCGGKTKPPKFILPHDVRVHSLSDTQFVICLPQFFEYSKTK